MSIRWNSPSIPRTRAAAGDQRIVRRFLFLPTKIGTEVRWLGVETIKQEAYIGWICPPEMKAYKGLKWRNVAWWSA